MNITAIIGVSALVVGGALGSWGGIAIGKASRSNEVADLHGLIAEASATAAKEVKAQREKHAREMAEDAMRDYAAQENYTALAKENAESIAVYRSEVSTLRRKLDDESIRCYGNPLPDPVLRSLRGKGNAAGPDPGSR